MGGWANSSGRRLRPFMNISARNAAASVLRDGSASQASLLSNWLSILNSVFHSSSSCGRIKVWWSMAGMFSSMP
jgi:hypothetical protein